MTDSESKKRIDDTLGAHLEVATAFRAACAGVIGDIAEACVAALRNGGKVCFFGNGGSAADAQHFAAEFVVRFVRNRAALPAIAFTTDTSILTACSNDFGYEGVFARQVEALCGPNDVVVGISTSGTSGNVRRGLEAARAKGAKTVAFTGESGGPCAEAADLALRVPSAVTARVQECHLIAGHIVCDLAEIAFSEN
ncbi:MAG: D-sedoheptulose 7-phosphate isomerase [Verrucomicrobiae bacterium]|nr:D-sedoheptulose 7-phosphate isomerase [Verrucomicrobiae bacterium]MCP5541785.1 D-sedoheptulose 7-phosphate isomerase [Akkermansiaceae bacterium]